MKKGFKECPFCANEIKKKAIKCQYCGEFLPKEEEKKEEPKKKAKKETKDCPFCMNKVDVDATICPFCDEKLDGDCSKEISQVSKMNSSLQNVERYKSRYLWICGLLIIDIIFLCNLSMSAYKRGYTFGTAVIRYVIIMLIFNAIFKKQKNGREDNPTKNKLTSGVLYFLGLLTLMCIIGYYGLYLR